jgi:hypothetical protein
MLFFQKKIKQLNVEFIAPMVVAQSPASSTLSHIDIVVVSFFEVMLRAM